MKNRIVVLTQVLLISIGLTHLASAQNTFWKDVLKPTHQVFSLCESNTGVLWAGGIEGNLYRSTNDGDKWDTVYNFGTPVGNVIVMPSGDLICYTFWSGIWRRVAHWSTDGGRSWTQSNDTVDLEYLAISPQGYLFRSTDRYLWRSTNEGITWDTFLKNPRNFITGIFFDSCSHVLISYQRGIERSGIEDSNWTNFSSSDQNYAIQSASTAPNGDIIAVVTPFASGAEGIAILRQGQWTLQGLVHYSDYYDNVQPCIDSSGNIYCYISAAHQSSDYGKSLVVSGRPSGNCDGSRFLYSKNGYLFLAAGCEVLRSVDRLHDSVCHFPAGTTPGCSTRLVAAGLNLIRTIASSGNQLLLSNGGIAEIAKINASAIGYLTSMPEAYGGPMVIQNDSFFFVNYDNDHAEKNWSKVSKIPSSGGIAQQNILLQTQKITDMKSDDTALYLFCSATSDSSMNGKIMRYSLITRGLTTLVDSIAAFDGISVYGDSIYFGTRTTATKSGALNVISKSGVEVHAVRTGPTGACTVDSISLTYFSITDSLIRYSLRSQDTSFFTINTHGIVRRIITDNSSIYALASDSCKSSLLKISRSDASTLLLDDSIGCNPEMLLDSATIYVSDDLNAGRVRAICNPAITQNRSAIIPAELDFGTVSVGSTKLLPISNNSSQDYTVYPTVRNRQFTFYPPSLSIPAHSAMSFHVYCQDASSPEVEDYVDFSINGGAPYASTRLLATHALSVSNGPAVQHRLDYANGNLIITGVSGNYHLTRYDVIGRVLGQSDGIGTGESEFVYLPEIQQFSIVRLQYGNMAETLKLFR